MGKVRVKTIGIDEEESKEKKKLKERNEAKKAEAAKRALKNVASNATAADQNLPTGRQGAETNAEKDATKDAEEKVSEDQSESAPKSAKIGAAKQSKYKAKTSKKKQPHSSSYLAMAKMVDKNKKYSLAEGLKILNSTKLAKFDQTIELHINTMETGVSGSLTLPHGTGKKMKVEIADHTADPKHLEELIKKIEGGNIDFDILIATPDTMSHLAKVARFLGPKGLMPNPKNGTINPKPKEAAKKFEGGQINFKTEAKAPIIHLTVGKLSFEEKQLTDNIKAILQAVKTQNIKNVTLKSTMGPGIKIVI